VRPLILVALLALTACSGPLGLLTGGGPKVSANVQAGKENTQQLVGNQTNTEAGRDIVQQTSPITSDNIEEVTIQQTPLWMMLLLILGWLLPSPNEISRFIRGLFKR